MKLRIAIWAIAGFLIAGFWALYLYPTLLADPILAIIARATCPITFASFGIRFYWVLLANAATYALIGLIFEALRQMSRSKLRDSSTA
jgi:hypothetical protein